MTVPPVPGNCRGRGGGVTLRPLPRFDFLKVKGGANSRVVTISFSPQGVAYTRALKSEKSLFPPIPVGGGRWIQMTVA